MSDIEKQQTSAPLLNPNDKTLTYFDDTLKVNDREKSIIDNVNHSFNVFFMDSIFNVLLICIPLSIAGKYMNWNESIVFITSLLSLIPLAERLSFVCEDVSKYTNETVGGLIGATFGNATELIVSIMALLVGKLWIVQVSLLGSILSNALLVLGSAFLVGGIKYDVQVFNKTAASTNVVLMILSVTTLLIPSILDSTGESKEEGVLFFSRGVSILLMICYCSYLFFQLKTHSQLFSDAPETKPVNSLQNQVEEGQQVVEEEGEEKEEDEEPVFGIFGGIVILSFLTFFISILSSYLVDYIEEASSQLHIPPFFIATIILPIAGNACEHTSALIFAYKNKMALALGIAIGSVVQIAFFVIPLMVIVAWTIGQPLSLDFHIYQVASIFLCTIIVAFVVNHGKSNWLQGVLLMSAYCVIALGFWIHVDPNIP